MENYFGYMHDSADTIRKMYLELKGYPDKLEIIKKAIDLLDNPDKLEEIEKEIARGDARYHARPLLESKAYISEFEMEKERIKQKEIKELHKRMDFLQNNPDEMEKLERKAGKEDALSGESCMFCSGPYYEEYKKWEKV